MRRQRRTKIVATLGPASSERAQIAKLFEAGADVFRINMSHTPPDRMRELVRTIRAVEKHYGRPIAVLVDLQGPKLRIGSFATDAVTIDKGARFVLDSDPAPGNAERVHLPHPEILAALEPGHTLLLDDGKIRLTAVETSAKRAVTRVEVGGKLTARKGVSLPDTTIALMVARGDLGVEMPLEKVPGIQKQLTRTARRAGKPVVVATQMLESMISSPVPTRAEVSDVATAIFEGADAVMLSAESASGQYPVEAVATMNRIAEEVERDPTYRTIIHAQRTDPEATGADAIAAASRQIAETLDLSAVICWTSSGATALRVARERPAPAIVAISPNVGTGRKLALVWGVHCVVAEDARDQDDMVDRACRMAFKDGFAKAGERVIIVAGVPLGTPGATNMVRIAYVGQEATSGE